MRRFSFTACDIAFLIVVGLCVGAIWFLGGMAFFKDNSPSYAMEVIVPAKQEEGAWYKYYTSYYVQNGDTLWDLAEAYMDDGGHYTRESWVKEVIEMNSLSRNGFIRIGQHLSLPYYSQEYKCGFTEGGED